MNAPIKTFSTMLLFAFLSTASWASDRDGRYAVKGVGVLDCRAFLQAWEQKDRKLYAYGGWLEGFLSAENRYREDTFDLAPWQNTNLLLALLANHCKSHPKQPFVTATRAMLKALHPQRIRTSTPIIQVRNNGKATLIYRETLRRVQQVLEEQGFYEGKVDGRFTPSVRDALVDFQASRKLPQTGLPDQRTLILLFNPQKRNTPSS